jgi:signal transduction histidine kinase
MRYRVASEGGSFRVETAPGQGTRLLARLPLRPQAASPAAEPSTAPDPL